MNANKSLGAGCGVLFLAAAVLGAGCGGVVSLGDGSNGGKLDPEKSPPAAGGSDAGSSATGAGGAGAAAGAGKGGEAGVGEGGGPMVPPAGGVGAGATAGAGAASGTAGAGGAGQGATGGAGAGASGAGGASAYPGKGFVVHEWGTNTVVVGSDGSMQRGLHHEEEDLPGFVYDRVKAGDLPGSTSSVFVKMETPVTYFYSDTARAVKASVDFPQGVFTQWYPAVSSFYPVLVATSSPDKLLDPHAVWNAPSCQAQYGTLGNGLLDWGTVQILAPGAAPPIAPPDAPFDQFTWSYARQVMANTVVVSGNPGAPPEAPQAEKFLFYRGLGNFALPAQTTADAGGQVRVTNVSKLGTGATFVIHVGADRADFVAQPEGGNFIHLTAPPLDGAPLLADFVVKLSAAVTAALDATGLYHDEAVAMVNTWSRQWFRTPGLRVLYLLPQSFVEQQIPLTIDPKPDTVVRVMMIRTEVITPELEAQDTSLLSVLPDPKAQGYFVGLGRFAEPRLRRAMALGGSSAAAQALLDTITSVDLRVGAQ